MPYKKRARSARRFRKKKSYKKRKTNTVSINRPFANSKICKMRYCDTFTLDAGAAGAGVVHRFRANSIFDPDLTGAGHSPLGKTQLDTLYQHYCVLGSKIRITALATGAGPSDNSYITCQLTDTTASAGTITTYIEQKRGSYKMIGATIGGANKATVGATYSAKKFFGIKDVKDNIGRIGAQMTANPTEDALFEFGTQQTGTSDPFALDCMVVIDYIVLLTEPRFLAQS